MSKGSVHDLIVVALQSASQTYSATFENAIGGLARVSDDLVDPALQEIFDGALAQAKRAGWRSAELDRAVARLLTPRHASLLAWGRVPQRLSIRAVAIRECIQTIALLVDLEQSPRVGNDPSSRTGLDEKVLARVRGLLAKAESTEFPDEADALTAKAQELMSRYSIDRALLEGTDPSGVVSRRIAIDDPYARAKSLLFSRVAAANRCEALWSKNVGLSTVVGHPDHLDACELLYTSLLVQADAAMIAAGRQTGAGARARSRSFRQSFLVAFASRIGERLMEATTQAEAEAVAEHGDSILPVLAGRSKAVEDAFHRAFPHIRMMNLSVTDSAGAAAGRIAADNADLLSVEALQR
jgi:hypothetical protein